MQQNLLELYKRYVPRMFMGHSMQINSSKFLCLLWCSKISLGFTKRMFPECL